MGPSEIVGREAELARAQAFLDRVDELPALLAIEGEAGIGKTALWHEVVAAARTGGFGVLTARPAPAETRLSFSALGDLFAELGDETAELPRPQQRALDIALLRAPGGEAPPDARTIGTAVLGLLRRLASDGKVVVALDDAQWLDAASAAALGYAARRLMNEKIAFVVATRKGEMSALSVDERELRNERIDLGPLSLGAVQRVVLLRLGLELARPLLRRVHGISGGNPLYALELARWSRREGADGALPPSLAEAFRGRIDVLPPRTRDALLEVAAIGDPVAARVDHDAIVPALDAGIVEIAADRLQFVHPLYAAVVYDGSDPWRRRAVHRQLAETATTKEERARHLALAADPPDAGVAAALQDGGDSARARGAVGAAAELFERSLLFTPDGSWEEIAARALAAATAHNEDGDGTRAREIVATALERLPPGEERGRVLIWRTTFEVSLVSAEAALREVTEPSSRVDALGAHAEALFHAGRLDEALTAAGEAVVVAALVADPNVVARALTRRGYLGVLHGDADARRYLDEALVVEPEFGGDPFYGAATARAVVQLWADELDEPRQTLTRIADYVGARGDDNVRHGLLIHLLKVAWRAGDLDALRALSAEVVAMREASGWSQIGSTGWATALPLALAGDADGARRAAGDGLARATESGDRLFAVYNRSLLGHVEVMCGDPAAALCQLEPLPDDVKRMGIAEPGMFAFHADELEALVGAGKLGRAAERVAEVEAEGRRLDRPRELVAAGRGRALLLAADGAVEEAIAETERLAPLLDRLPVPVERGRTLLLLGSLRRRARRRASAREALDAADALFRSLGAEGWAQSAQAEAGRLGGRAAGTGLTTTEERVAALAARGLATKQIASALVVSPKTIEKHLSQIYAKLGVRSRAELAHEMSKAGGNAP